MKKLKDFFKSNKKIVKSFIIGGIIFGGITTVVADAILASQIDYTPPSGIASSATNVGSALDELYSLVNPSNMGAPLYYAFGTPTTESETTPPSGKNVYVGLYADKQYGVCMNRNGTQHCFRNRNWIAESKHIQELFSGVNDSCDDALSGVYCDASDFYCVVSSDGSVSCQDRVMVERCFVDVDDSVYCD